MTRSRTNGVFPSSDPEWTVMPMPLAPEDIQSREFLITLRGYDKEEVRSFLRVVADDYRTVAGGGAMPASIETVGGEVSGILQAAKEAAERIRTEAAQEAKAIHDDAGRIRERAEDEAQRQERDTTVRLGTMLRRLESLQSTETKIRERLYALVGSIMESLREEQDQDQDQDVLVLHETGELDTGSAEPQS